MITPAIIGYTAMQFQRHIDLASLEIEGSLDNTDNLGSLESKPKVGQRVSELHTSRLEKDKALVGTPAWDRFVSETHQIGAIPVNMLARAPNGTGGFDFLLTSFVIGSWSVFETMAGDLWEAALNIDPSGLAHLKGSPNRLRATIGKQGLGGARPKKDDTISKSVDLDLIQFHKFDLRNRMGTILRNRYEFSRLSTIREAYSAAFDTNTGQVDAALKDDSLDALNVARNVLVHRAAIVDQEYVRRAQGLKSLPKVEIGRLLKLDGEVVVSLIKPALIQASKLLGAVDEWLYKHRPT
jgi:hypothetical protein